MAKITSGSAVVVVLCAWFLPLSSFAAGAAPGYTSAPVLNWDRDLAMRAAKQEDTRAEATRLVHLATHSKGATTLRALNELAGRSQWTEPAREAVLYRFTSQLRNLSPFSIDAAVLEFLLTYQNRVLVAHEESGTVTVPLFPIRAAARGLVNQWTRQQSAVVAAELMAADPRQLLALYVSSVDPNVRAGIELAVSNADRTALHNVLEVGMPQLANHPGLTGLLGRTALEAGDLKAMTSVFNQGSGAPLVELSRQASQRFSDVELGKLLLDTMDHAPAETAAVLIAELSPRSMGQEGVGDAIIKRLGDPVLGSTAALAVAQWGTDRQLSQLEAIAAKDPTSLATKRARTALSTQPENRQRGALQ